MRLFTKMKDGGPESKVTGYFLIEWKRVFSIVLLRFDHGSREAYHDHAFNAVSWVIKGSLREETPATWEGMPAIHADFYTPSLKPVITRRSRLHKVFGLAPRTWVLSLRGPWTKTWKEVLPDGRVVTLSEGRKECAY